MTRADPVIVGVGLFTPVGLSAKEAAAAIRSAVMRFTETPIHDHQFSPFTLAEIPDEALPPPLTDVAPTGVTQRELRLVRLAATPLLECLAAVPAVREPPLMLALPEVQPARPIDGKRVLELLARQVDRRFDVARSAAVDRGRAGGLVAVARAAELVRSGQHPFAIGGGVDTYRDLFVLGVLDSEQRVKSDAHLDGFVPGEGAAFVMVASPSAAHAAGLRQLGRLTRVAEGVEPGHLYADAPYRGDGLTGAVRELVRSASPSAPFADVWSSMNGESYWAKEWGVSYLRNRAAFAEDHATYHPADCTGDTGAACGPLMIALAALGIRDGYRRAPALVYCSSDRGARAALAIDRA